MRMKNNVKKTETNWGEEQINSIDSIDNNVIIYLYSTTKTS